MWSSFLRARLKEDSLYLPPSHLGLPLVCDKELGKVEPKRATPAQPLLLRARAQLEALAEIVTVGLTRAVEWNLASSLPE